MKQDLLVEVQSLGINSDHIERTMHKIDICFSLLREIESPKKEDRVRISMLENIMSLTYKDWRNRIYNHTQCTDSRRILHEYLMFVARRTKKQLFGKKSNRFRKFGNSKKILEWEKKHGLGSRGNASQIEGKAHKESEKFAGR